jgi:hypothetical protein
MLPLRLRHRPRSQLLSHGPRSPYALIGPALWLDTTSLGAACAVSAWTAPHPSRALTGAVIPSNCSPTFESAGMRAPMYF